MVWCLAPIPKDCAWLVNVILAGEVLILFSVRIMIYHYQYLPDFDKSCILSIHLSIMYSIVPSIVTRLSFLASSVCKNASIL